MLLSKISHRDMDTCYTDKRLKSLLKALLLLESLRMEVYQNVLVPILLQLVFNPVHDSSLALSLETKKLIMSASHVIVKLERSLSSLDKKNPVPGSRTEINETHPKDSHFQRRSHSLRMSSLRLMRSF